MKCIDSATRDDLAKSSTILQCILSILEFECAKSHIQPEVIGVEENQAMVNVDPMDIDQMLRVCDAVNRQFQRLDRDYTCKITNDVDGFITCTAGKLDEYILLS